MTDLGSCNAHVGLIAVNIQSSMHSRLQTRFTMIIIRLIPHCMSLARLRMHRYSAPPSHTYTTSTVQCADQKLADSEGLVPTMYEQLPDIFNTTQLYLSSYHLTRAINRLQMRQNSIRTGNLPRLAPSSSNTTTGQDTYLNNPLLRLNLRIGYLAMVNDNRIPARPAPTRPPNAVREPRVGIGKKQLQTRQLSIPP